MPTLVVGKMRPDRSAHMLAVSLRPRSGRKRISRAVIVGRIANPSLDDGRIGNPSYNHWKLCDSRASVPETPGRAFPCKMHDWPGQLLVAFSHHLPRNSHLLCGSRIEGDTQYGTGSY
jgi:hypothetical protein